jgi:hypothetical protein
LRHVFALQDSPQGRQEHRAWSVSKTGAFMMAAWFNGRYFILERSTTARERVAWSKPIEVFDEGAGQSKQIALFPESCAGPRLRCGVDPVERHAVASA